MVDSSAGPLFLFDKLYRMDDMFMERTVTVHGFRVQGSEVADSPQIGAQNGLASKSRASFT